MAPKQKNKVAPQSSFAELILRIAHRFSITHVFDDFLTMSIAALTQNLATKVSWYEEEYLKTIERYRNSDLRFEFPNVFAVLVDEMEHRYSSASGNDVLGEFFEQHISNGRNGQFFTPYHICRFMTLLNQDSLEQHDEQLRILDSSCGSGRMLLAAHQTFGVGHEYFGIDIDLVCVKMAALNLFLNGIWNSEVLCANALIPGDFVIAYKISFLPLGIFKIEQKEHSRLWQLHNASFETPATSSDSQKSVRFIFHETSKEDGVQLDLFNRQPPA